MEKSADAFRTISEVSDILDTPAHVLRFWESRFAQIRPVKRAGGRRYYRPSDVALLGGIKRLLHDEGLTIRGVQKVLREQGIRHVAGLTGAGRTAIVAQPPDLPEEAAPPEPTVATSAETSARPKSDGKVPSVRRTVPKSTEAASAARPEPLPLWAAAVERIGKRPAAPSAQASHPMEPAQADADDPIWFPPVLRAMSPVQAAAHRDRLLQIQARLLALRNRVADAARHPAP